ncbi:MAG: NAD(P)-dependent oxidoreductase [Deltaproteobacteria bacterium]|nr:NAD(P)-dependent oxidoreductase [Deltaproteobacteria bacterium]
MTTRVGYIGLGDMGLPMASHLVPAGFETTVCDLDDSKVQELVEGGARAAANAREVGERSDVLCVCVPADAHVRAVLIGKDGALEGVAPGTLIAIHSTVLPETIKEMAEAAEAKGCKVIDACVTGGAHGAAAGELTFLVGGEDASVEKARPVLDASSKAIVHAGPLGSGAKLKLAVNTLTYIQWAAARESFLLAKASGLDPDVFIEAVRSNGQLTDLQLRFLGLHRMPEEAASSEAFQAFSRLQMHTAEKDLAHALELARKHGLAMPTAGLVSQDMARIYRVKDEGRR